MARKVRNTVPTSVVLTHEQKALIKSVGEKEQRTFSHQVRYILQSWCDHTNGKEKRNGKESKKAEEVGQ